MRPPGRRRAAILAAATAVALGGAVATGLAGGDDDGPRAPVPRACWWSDYANAKLSNKCEYREDERRWYMKVGDRMVPADEQPLPTANLCLYFHGRACPER